MCVCVCVYVCVCVRDCRPIASKEVGVHQVWSILMGVASQIWVWSSRSCMYKLKTMHNVHFNED